MPVTFCSRIDGTRAWKTRPVCGRRSPACAARGCAQSGGGDEQLRLIVLADEASRAGEAAAAPGAPCPRRRGGVGASAAGAGCRTVGGAEGEPRLGACRAGSCGRPAVDEGSERRGQVKRSPQVERALDHRRIERSSGVARPARPRSPSRLRMPRQPSATTICAHAAPSELPGPGTRTIGRVLAQRDAHAGGEVVRLGPCARACARASSAGSVDHGVKRAPRPSTSVTFGRSERQVAEPRGRLVDGLGEERRVVGAVLHRRNG